MWLIIISLIVLIVLTLWIHKKYSRETYDSGSNSYECPEYIVDPNTLEKCILGSKQGKDLLNRYMANHFLQYLNKTKNDWNYVTPTEFKNMDKSNIFLLDVRRPEDFNNGHIHGATNIFWLDLMKPENLSKLPYDKKIALVCYVGHTSSQILVLLKLLGYDVVSIKFGMGISPVESVPIAGWSALGYPVEK